MSADEQDSENGILRLGAEGGSLAIQRFRAPDGAWKFILVVDESTMADFLDDNDLPDFVKQHPPVDTFEEAIQMMNKYPWREMEVIAVHPAYADFIWTEKQIPQTQKERKMMPTHGELTSAVARSITEEMNARGYDIYYDHEKASQFTGTIAVSFNQDKLVRKEEISQLDIAIVERGFDRVIALVEIEETTDKPKTFLGDVFSVLFGEYIFFKRTPLFIKSTITLVVVGVIPTNRDVRNKGIQDQVNRVKTHLGTRNARIGKVLVLTYKDEYG